MSASHGPGDIFELKKLRRLIELMKEHDLSEVDLKQADQRVRVRRGGEALPASGPFVVSSPRSAAAAPAEAAPAAPAESSRLQVVKSPMVGTFYVASSPESPAFVKVGDRIGAEQTICIIEAMKVFNEIPSGISGQVVAILVENGAPVEFGQPLVKIDPGA
jgi:acetyl-CoA carboxylase biotin carboxyl carrier protein